MHHENRHYGHDQILRRYANVKPKYSIPGQMQHGWTPGPGLLADRWSSKWPKYVWSRRNLGVCIDHGLPRAVPIGAPFLYVQDDQEVGFLGERSLVVFPMHGWEYEKIVNIYESFRSYAGDLNVLMREGFQPITVCLYWNEYQDPRIRSIFEDLGFRVVTNGHRDNNPQFLLGLNRLLRSHKYASSNALGTAIFCAMWMGLPTFLYGSSMKVECRIPRVYVDRSSNLSAEMDRLSYKNFRGDLSVDLGSYELGYEFKLEPAVLCELFGWVDFDCRQSIYARRLMAFRMLQERILRRVDRFAGRGVWSRRGILGV